jgi:hypothetical protein
VNETGTQPGDAFGDDSSPPVSGGRIVDRARWPELATRELLPGLVVLAITGIWAAYQAGYPPTVWYPGGLLLLALLATVILSYRGVLRGLPRSTKLAIGFLGGFAAWSFASVAWAELEDYAWDGANRTFLYLVVYTLFAILPWTPAQGGVLLGVYVLASAGVLGGFVVRAGVASDPSGFFTAGRLAEPAGYINATCGLALLAFWPAVFLSSRRETPWFLRGVFLASAGLFLDVALLTQSRGALFTAPAVLALYLALVPGRVRSLSSLAPTALVVLLWRDPILDVYGADVSGRAAALDAALDALLVSVLVLFPVGTALGLVDRSLRIGPETSRRLRQIAGVVAAAAGIAIATALLATYGSPVQRAENAWDEFKAGETVDYGGSHFSALGSNRYDFWRVAMGEFKDAPLTGAGVDNFAVTYARERRSDEEPLYPHSLPVMVLSQTGVVGGILLLGFLVSALAAVGRARSRSTPFGWALAATGVIAFAYFAIHGSVDWFWEFPGLGAPAFAFLGLGAGIGRTRVELDLEGGRHRVTRAVVCGVVVGLLTVAAASFVFPWLAARNVDEAARNWRSDPEAAFEKLDRARTLNPLSDRPDLVAGVIASRIEDWGRMRASFQRALERNASGWYAHLELAIVDALEGRREDALRLLQTARTLNPLDPVLADVQRKVAEGEAVSPHAIDRLFVQRVEARSS